jgi:nitrate/nitrite transporter NarK
MVFGMALKKTFMSSKSSNPTTLLIAVIVIFTFPIWIGIAGGIFGLIIGLFGAAIGIVAGVFGAVFGAIGGIFGWFFDWDWPHHGFYRWNIFTVVCLVVIVLLVTRSRRLKH